MIANCPGTFRMSLACFWDLWPRCLSCFSTQEYDIQPGVEAVAETRSTTVLTLRHWFEDFDWTFSTICLITNVKAVVMDLLAGSCAVDMRKMKLGSLCFLFYPSIPYVLFLCPSASCIVCEALMTKPVQTQVSQKPPCVSRLNLLS